MEAVEWSELIRKDVSFNPAEITTPASALAFDTTQDLLWVGDEYGHLTSFSGFLLERYTSIVAHPEEHGPVKQILFADRGVLSVAPTSVNFSTRRGLDIWHLTDDEGMRDLQCMALMGRDASASSGTAGVFAKTLVAGGCQDDLLKIDIVRGEVVERVKAAAQYTMMRRTATYILAATNDGHIHVLDPNSLSLAKTLTSNNACFSDMDARGNFLVTCGWVNRPQGTRMLSGLANVYDLRAMVQLPPVSFSAGAAHVQMHPKMNTTCIVGSQHGHLQESDVLNQGPFTLRQANVQLAMQGMALAPSGEALAIADASGTIALWGSSTRQNFVEYPHPIDFPESKPALFNFDVDAPVSLSQLVPMPFHRDPLLSIWPNDHVYEVGKAQAKIPSEVMHTLKDNNGVGMWTSNPFEKRDWPRNVIREIRGPESDGASVVAPKFLSEKAKNKPLSHNVERRISDIQDLADNVASGMGITKDEVPIMYRNVEIKYSKFGVDDFDFKFYNRTRYSGLETHIANSYVNPLLQLLRFTPFIRNLALHHVAANCLGDPCLLCEFGFLFDTLEKAEGQNCQATNFLKAFSSIPDAARLNLLEEYSHASTLAEMLQAANRFFLTQVSNDYRRVAKDTRGFDQTFAIDAVSTLRCNHCHNDMLKPGTTWSTDLNYSPVPGTRPLRNQAPTFSQILKQSVDSAMQSRGWCDRCKRYQNLQTRRTLRNMPDVLILNALSKSPDAKRYWSQPGWLPDKIGVSIDNGKFVCFEGEDLRLHLEKKMYNIKVYDLVGVVADVHSAVQQKSHLVSIINVGISDKETPEGSEWHLFNDFLVRTLTKEEALRFPAWKIPATLTYQAAEGRHAVDDSWRDNLDTTLLFSDWSSNGIAPERCRPLDKNFEPPGAGDPIAIDTEFVALQQEEIEIKADGEREVIRPTRLGLARVSVLRGVGNDESLPFINDYITVTETVVDFLTKWSGVIEGDLDPRTSTHPLVPLKVAYKKLWLLVNLGCVFVGHGLPKDFRTINIHVPKSQVLDTVEMFYIPSRQRKLSLRYLCWYLLQEDIQQDNHDSIEDARTALRLWRKYEEFKDAGVVEQMLTEIYREGRKWNFKPPSEAESLMKHLAEGSEGGSLLNEGSLTGRETPDMMAVGGISGTGTPAASSRIKIRSTEFDSPGR